MNANSTNSSKIDDSTSNDWQLNATNSPHEETGMIGYAQTFDKPDEDYFSKQDELSDWCTNVTVTAWWNLTETDTSDKCIVARAFIYGDFYHSVDDGTTIDLYWGGNGSFTNEQYTLNPTEDVWYFSGKGRDNSTQNVYSYVNGSLVRADSYSLWVYTDYNDTGNPDVSIGTGRDTPSNLWNGTIDYSDVL